MGEGIKKIRKCCGRHISIAPVDADDALVVADVPARHVAAVAARVDGDQLGEAAGGQFDWP